MEFGTQQVQLKVRKCKCKHKLEIVKCKHIVNLRVDCPYVHLGNLIYKYNSESQLTNTSFKCVLK